MLCAIFIAINEQTEIYILTLRQTNNIYFITDSMSSTSESKLPDIIKIDDISSGRIDPNLIYQELERLKVEINILRNDMSLFLKALATIPDNQSQQEYYKIIVLRLRTVQNSIKEYCVEYNKLLPIINLSQIKLGHEVEILPQNRTNASNQKTPDIKQEPKKSNTSNKATALATTDTQNNKNGLNSNQPIVL